MSASVNPTSPSEAVCRHAPDGRCIAASESALAVFGWAPSELVGRSIDELARPRDTPAVRAMFGSSSTGPVTYRARRADGAWAWLETSAHRVLDEQGEVAEVLTVTRPARALSRGGRAADAEPPASGGRLRVLVVDHEERMTRLAALMLAAEGHAVETASSGEEALELLATHEVDAVITGLSLGQGMHGWALAKRVRALRPRTRIVLATGWGSEVDRSEARTLVVDAVLAKPFRLSDLRRALEGPP